MIKSIKDYPEYFSLKYKNYDLDYGYPEAGRVVYSNLTYKF